MNWFLPVSVLDREDLAKKLRPIPPLEFKSFSDCSYLTCKAYGKGHFASRFPDIVIFYKTPS